MQPFLCIALFVPTLRARPVPVQHDLPDSLSNSAINERLMRTDVHTISHYSPKKSIRTFRHGTIHGRIGTPRRADREQSSARPSLLLLRSSGLHFLLLLGGCRGRGGCLFDLGRAAHAHSIQDYFPGQVEILLVGCRALGKDGAASAPPPRCPNTAEGGHRLVDKGHSRGGEDEACRSKRQRRKLHGGSWAANRNRTNSSVGQGQQSSRREWRGHHSDQVPSRYRTSA
jgi:hypothetical protein